PGPAITRGGGCLIPSSPGGSRRMSSLDRFIRLVRYLKPYRLRLCAAFACSGLVAASSGAYAWLVKPVLDEIFININEALLLALPLALFAVSVLKSAFSYGQNYLMNY